MAKKIVKETILRMKAEEFIKSGKRFNAFRVIPDCNKGYKIGMLTLFAWRDDEGYLIFTPSSVHIDNPEIENMWRDCFYEVANKYNGKEVKFDTFTADERNIILSDDIDAARNLLSGDIANIMMGKSMVYAF